MKKMLLLALTLSLLAATTQADTKITQNLQKQMAIQQEEQIPVIVFTKPRAQKTATATLAETTHATHSYNKLNAFATKLTPQQITNLAENPETTKIFPEGVKHIAESSIALSDSVNQINAPDVWAQNITGQNITVAVIDTGVDYTHPDLGNCTQINSSCRVRGGYDYYNNDPDPQDDHSHGTHCAGIIAANGAIKGVAPDAKLLAYKVCDSSGNMCPDSAIISAIDAAITEGAQIISISLAGYANPNDGVGAVEYALNLANDFGVASTVAAGNHGPGTGSLEAPSHAEKTISVGKTNGVSMSSDSGRGPAAFGRAKPDLVAPGATIYSTCPVNRGSYCTKSGTSMATPHVAGTIALLLQQNPNLTTDEIKKTIKQTATDINAHVFSQGAGQINALNAINQKINASIYKWETKTHPGFNKTKKILIHNKGNTTLIINFSTQDLTDYEGDNNIKNTNIIHPTQTTINANTTQEIQLKIIVPENATPGIYGTTLTATTNDNQTLRIPIALSVTQQGSGIISGTINRGGTNHGGDHITIPYTPSRKKTTTITLNYTANDIDLYVYAEGGQLVDSVTDNTNPKTITITNTTQNTYWIIFRGYSVSGTKYYTLNITETTNLTITPQQLQTHLTLDKQNITLTITNDETQKQNITPQVLLRQLYYNNTTTSNTTYINAADQDTYCVVDWLKNDLNLTLSELSDAAVNISWNSSHDLILALAYKTQAGGIHDTRYTTSQNNHISGNQWEYLTQTDISYYANTHADIGILVCNADTNQSFNSTYNTHITLYNKTRWEATTITPPTIDLSPNETINTTIHFNITQLQYGLNYEAYYELPNHAQTPLDLTAKPTAPILTPIPPTQNTTVTINWTQSITVNNQTLQNTSNYNISWSQDENYSTQNTKTTNTTNTTLNLTQGTHYARVQAIDENNITSEWSNTINITVDTTPPTTPQINPLPQETRNDTLNISFTNATDNLTQIQYYTIQLSDTTNYTNIISEQNTTNTTIQTQVLYDKKYYARVRATDEAQNQGDWSTQANFTVKTITINEILPNPTNQSPWIEIYNTKNKTHSLADWSLQSSSTNTTLNATINATGYLIIHTNQTTLNINTTNDSIQLKNQQSTLIDSTTYENLTTDRSFGRREDGVGEFIIFDVNQTTPGAANNINLQVTLGNNWNLLSIPLNL